MFFLRNAHMLRKKIWLNDTAKRRKRKCFGRFQDGQAEFICAKATGMGSASGFWPTGYGLPDQCTFCELLLRRQ